MPLIAKRQDNVFALYAYSHLAYLVGDLQKADKAIKEVYRLRDKWDEAIILHTNILGRMNRNEEALSLLKAQVEAQPDNAVLSMFYARKLVDAKNLEAAYAQFNRLLESSPKQYDARYAAGLISLRLGKFDASRSHLETLLKANQRTSDAHFYLGQLAERQHDNDAAIQHYSEVRNGDYEIDARLRTAVLMARKGEVDDARALLRPSRQPMPIPRSEFISPKVKFCIRVNVMRRPLTSIPKLWDRHRIITTCCMPVHWRHKRSAGRKSPNRICATLLHVNRIMHRP